MPSADLVVQSGRLTTAARLLIIGLVVVLAGLAGVGFGVSARLSRDLREAKAAQLQMQSDLDLVKSQLLHDEGVLSSTSSGLTDVQAKLRIEKQATLDVAKVAKLIGPSVFTIHTTVGLGTGFAFFSNGTSTWLVTNWHVIAAATSGTRTVAVVQGSQVWSGYVYSWDRQRDLALVRVHRIFPVLRSAYAAGDPPGVGDQVLAYGSPYGLENTVTQGIISAIRTDFVQTDALINHGNSGGPLVNVKGEVLGVNSYDLAGGGSGLGLAIDVRVLCQSLLRSATCG